MSRPRPEQGSGTIQALALILLVLIGVSIVAGVTAGVLAGHRAAHAADLAALAAADTARGLAPGEPCAVASSVAEANGATLTSCDIQGPEGNIVQVSVTAPMVDLGSWSSSGSPQGLGMATASARAGPPP